MTNISALRKSAFALAGLVVVASLAIGMAMGQQSRPTIPAVPIDATTGVLEVFKTHDVVALGEGGQATLLCWRDPRTALLALCN